MKKLLIEILTCTLLSSPLPALAGAPETNLPSTKTEQIRNEAQKAETNNTNIYSEKIEPGKTEDLDKLKTNIIEQRDRINNLEMQLEKNAGNGMNFAAWAGILLTAVATLVTILGVFMALFSFFGYKKIMSSAQDVATEKACSVAEEVATQRTPDATKDVLIKMVDDGDFNKIIFEAVEQVIYRGIQFPSQDELTGENQ